MSDPFNSPAPPSSGPSRFTLDALLDRFGGAVDEEADGYLVRCPSHEDTHASLRVALSDAGKVLLKCRVGCSFPQVLKAANLRASDLFDVSPGTAPRLARQDSSPVSVADRAALAVYLDRANNALAEDAYAYAERRFGLDPFQVHRLGLGFDPGTLESGSVVLSTALYRDAPRLVVPFLDFEGVPQYLQARALKREVKAKWSGPANPEGAAWGKFGVFRSETGWHEAIVTEGPGDALTAVGAGYDAVLIRGAGLANSPGLADEIAAGLEGRKVIVAGDADTAGMKFTRDVADALSQRGVEVHRLHMPEGVNDLTDWRESAGAAFAKAFVTAVQEADSYGSDEITAETIAQDITRLFSDVYNAQVLHRVIQDQGRDVRWTEIGFVVYEESHGVWRSDSEEWVRRQAHTVAERVQRDILAEMQRMDARIARIADPALKEAIGKSLDKQRAKARGSWLVSYVMSSKGIDYMIRELRALPGVAGSIEDFDRHPRLLPARNGIIDLETGELLPYGTETKDLHLMRRVDIDFKPDATNPRWEEFLGQIFPDRPDLVGYLQNLVGYGITGLTTEQCFAIFWGNGANGKSVVTDTLTGIFRGITVTTPFSTFEAKPSGGIPNDLAALKGSRLVMASEGEQGKPMAEATIKRLTGSDMISARYLHKEFFEFKPTFLIILATNYRPNFRGQDDGIWRRVRLIPFTAKFPKGHPLRDDYLTAKFLGEFVPRAAWRTGDDFGDGPEGILAWAVKGAQRYLTEGLKDPVEVESATKEYRTTSDALAGFLGDDPHGNLLIKDPEGKVTGKDAWDLYRNWVQDEGLDKKEQWRRATLFDALEERGAVKRKSGGAFYFRGIRRVKPSEAAAEPDEAAPPATPFQPF